MVCHNIKPAVCKAELQSPWCGVNLWFMHAALRSAKPKTGLKHHLKTCLCMQQQPYA